MAGLIFILAVVGFVFDRRYVKAGGVSPTARHRTYLVIAAAACLLLVVALASIGASPYALGQATALLVALLFGLWELGRYRVRIANPVGRTPPVKTGPSS